MIASDQRVEDDVDQGGHADNESETDKKSQCGVKRSPLALEVGDAVLRMNHSHRRFLSLRGGAGSDGRMISATVTMTRMPLGCEGLFA